MFSEEELLSMGQGMIVDSMVRDCDDSIFLQSWQCYDSNGTPWRALALYDVVHNCLGFFYPWPGADFVESQNLENPRNG